MEHGEGAGGDFVGRVEEVFEDLFAEEFEGGLIVRDGAGVDEVVPFLHVDLKVLLGADFVGEFALLVVAMEFGLGDFDAELSAEFFKGYAVGELVEPEVDLIEFFGGEFFEFDWELKGSHSDFWLRVSVMVQVKK